MPGNSRVPPTPPGAGGSRWPPAATTDRARREAPPVEAVIELDWRRWGAAVLRHKWLVLLGTRVGTGGGFCGRPGFGAPAVAPTPPWVGLPAGARPRAPGPAP